MGVVVKPKNLNDRQMKRVDKIESPERAKKVADRISERRNARGAETAVKPIMKKGGKAQNGTKFGMLSVKAGIDKNPNPTQADRIAGAKKMAKSGSTVSMQLGSYKNVIGKNTKGKATKAVGLTKAMNGKMMKGGGKCKNGC